MLLRDVLLLVLLVCIVIMLGHEVVLIQRGREPHKGSWAFPGGFVDYNEDPEHAALRELQEETSLVAKCPVLVSVHGKPNRDPRKHIVTIFYKAQVSSGCLCGDG